ncbi:MAG: HAD hydrolase-like protein [Xanthomonadales bacterium]|nr:HAD hydrolase-like protein [Xanthomonadales bacterium]
MNRLVLFDLDGTLIDSEAGIVGSMRHALAAMGAEPVAHEVLRGWIGPPLRMTFPEVLGDDPGRLEQAVAHYHERFDAVGWSEHAVYAGIAEVVAALAARGDRLAVVTSKLREQAERIVAHLPFGNLFERIYGPAQGSRTSEKAAMIAQALADFGAMPAMAAMIGDRRFDIEGARANGVRAVGVEWGFGTRAELEQAGADAIVDSPGRLVVATS